MEAPLALLVQGIRVVSPVQFIVKVNTQVYVFCHHLCVQTLDVICGVFPKVAADLPYSCPFPSDTGELLELAVDGVVREEEKGRVKEKII